MLTKIDPKTVSEFEDVRQLCWEYRTFLLGLGPIDRDIVTTFYPEDKYTTVLQTLETDYTPPAGGIKMALIDGQPVGCGMFHTFQPGDAEIKRIFVREQARGTGAGRKLMQALVEQCRAAGYSRILLDTGAPLEAAQKLYHSLGFQQRGFYQDVPEIARDRLICFEMHL